MVRETKIKKIIRRGIIGALVGYFGFNLIATILSFVRAYLSSKYEFEPSLLLYSGLQSFVYTVLLALAFILIDLKKKRSLNSLIAYVLILIAILIRIVITTRICFYSSLF